MICLAGKFKNLDFQTIMNTMKDFLYSAYHGTGDSLSSIGYDEYQMDVDVVDAMGSCA